MKRLKEMSFSGFASGGTFVSASTPAGCRGRGAGRGREWSPSGVVVTGVASGGVEPPKSAPNIFGPCQTARPRKMGMRTRRSFFCFASLAFSIASALFASRGMARASAPRDRPRARSWWASWSSPRCPSSRARAPERRPGRRRVVERGHGQGRRDLGKAAGPLLQAQRVEGEEPPVGLELTVAHAHEVAERGRGSRSGRSSCPRRRG